MSDINIVIVLSWVILAVVAGCVAQNIGRSFGTYFILSLLISPVIGLIILAIQGRVTPEERLDNESHIVYCVKCRQAFGSSPDKKVLECPDCGNRLLETTVLRADWREYPKEKKEQLKKAFEEGQFMRYESDSMAKNTIGNSTADEIKKYKELLDMGAISAEEYEAKKNQLLNI